MTVTTERKEAMSICGTCKKQIEFLPYRIVTLEDKSSQIRVLHFHYFAPCWNIDDFFQFHVNEKIVSLAYSYDEKMLKQPMILKNLERNLNLWI